MQVRLLGPVELWDGTASVPIGPRPRAVLAAISLDPGRVRSVDRLIAALGGDRAPTIATAQIRACVSAVPRAVHTASRLRRDVEDVGPALGRRGLSAAAQRAFRLRRVPEADDFAAWTAAEIDLGAMPYVRSEFHLARRHSERAGAPCERIGEYGRAGALCGVAAAVRVNGGPEASRPPWAGAPRLYQSAGDAVGEAHALRRIAAVALEPGRYGEALRPLDRALPAFQAIGDRLSEAVVRMRMGECPVRPKRHDEARPLLDLVMTTFRDVGRRTCEGHVLRLSGERLLADAAEVTPDRVAAHLPRPPGVAGRRRAAALSRRDARDQRGGGTARGGRGAKNPCRIGTRVLGR